MSVTVHSPQFVWARAHRAALLLVLVAMALATAAGLLITRLVSDAAPAAGTSVSTVHVPPVESCPLIGRPGPTPC
jgi:hypothetical protein